MSVSAETERKPKGNFLPSAETETIPKEVICQLSGPKPKPNFGRPLTYRTTSFIQVMPWAFKLCLAKVTGPSLLYMTVNCRPTCKRLIVRAYSVYTEGSFGNF